MITIIPLVQHAHLVLSGKKLTDFLKVLNPIIFVSLHFTLDSGTIRVGSIYLRILAARISCQYWKALLFHLVFSQDSIVLFINSHFSQGDFRLVWKLSGEIKMPNSGIKILPQIVFYLEWKLGLTKVNLWGIFQGLHIHISLGTLAQWKHCIENIVLKTMKPLYWKTTEQNQFRRLTLRQHSILTSKPCLYSKKCFVKWDRGPDTIQSQSVHLPCLLLSDMLRIIEHFLWENKDYQMCYFHDIVFFSFR